MNSKEIFRILNIEETKDVAAIKAAYRQQLIGVNPEDDAEGFKRLREAFEEATRLANIEESTETEESTPITRWVAEVEAVYNYLSKRTDVAVWKELFSSDICTGIDTFEEAREALLVFLMQHFRLPTDVWSLIHEQFELVDSKEELYEQFPVNFIDFAIEDPKNKEWLNFDYFEGDPESEVDEYIDLLLGIREMNGSQNYEEVQSLLSKVSLIDLYHPLFDVEKMIFLLNTEQKEEAAEIADYLYNKEYDDLAIRYYIAYIDIETNQLERGFKSAEKLCEEIPKHYGAICLIGSYYYKTEAFEESKEAYLSLIEDYPYDEILIQGMRRANDGLMNALKAEIDEDPTLKEKILELGWCYFQNSRHQECVDLLDGFEVDEENAYGYYNLFGRTYMAMGESEKAFPLVQAWISEIDKLQEDGTEETAKKIKRKSLAHYFLSVCHEASAGEVEGYNEDMIKAHEHIDLAIEMENSISDQLTYLIQKASLLMKDRNYEQCIQVCNEVIELDQNYYPAYIYRQQSNEHLSNNQEVIDDFYRAKELYPQGQIPYVLATKVFLSFDMLDDATNIIEQAKENQVVSKALSLKEIIIARKRASSDEDYKAVLSQLNQLNESLEEEAGDIEDVSLFNHEKAACYFELEEYYKALEYINKRLEEKKSDDSRQLKGRILFEMKSYEDALELYQEMIEDYPTYGYAYSMAGLCCQNMDSYDEAIEYYTKVIEYTPEDRYVHYRLMSIYLDNYTDDYELKYYELAIEHGLKQIDLGADHYDYAKLGIVYLEGYNFESALECFTKAVELEPTYAYAYNYIGYIYTMKKEYGLAEENYLESMKHGGESYTVPYKNIAILYRKMRDYERSIEAYENWAKVSSSPEEAIEEIAVVYSERQEWDKSIKTYDRILDMVEDGELEYLESITGVYILSNNKRLAKKFIKKMKKKYPNTKQTYHCMGNYALFIEDDREEAARCFKEADLVRRDEDNYNSRRLSSTYHRITSLSRAGKNDEIKPIVEEVMTYIEETYGSIGAWLNDPNVRKVRLNYLVTWHYYTGDYDQAKVYLDLMRKEALCYHCVQPFCYEQTALEGMIAEHDGRYEEAREKYEKAYDICPDNFDHLYLIRNAKA